VIITEAKPPLPVGESFKLCVNGATVTISVPLFANAGTEPAALVKPISNFVVGPLPVIEIEIPLVPRKSPEERKTAALH
jgi:hypothetical protein